MSLGKLYIPPLECAAHCMFSMSQTCQTNHVTTSPSTESDLQGMYLGSLSWETAAEVTLYSTYSSPPGLKHDTGSQAGVVHRSEFNLKHCAAVVSYATLDPQNPHVQAVMIVLWHHYMIFLFAD